MLCRPRGWALPLRFHEEVEAHDDEDHRNEVRLQRDWDQIEPDLEKSWIERRGHSALDWARARLATKDAWDRLHDSQTESEPKQH